MDELKNALLARLEHYQFLKHKEHLKQELMKAVEQLSPSRLRSRYSQGEKKYGTMTEEKLRGMDTLGMLEEEVADAFWYLAMHNQKTGFEKNKLPS